MFSWHVLTSSEPSWIEKYLANKENTSQKRDLYLNKHCRYQHIVSEYDQEIPQSQTADNPVAPRGKAAQPSRDTRKTN